MQGYVKHGDYLRTLGGAMTAQCKVLHLLFSQSDYPKSVISFKVYVCVCVRVCVCVFLSVCFHREDLVAANWSTHHHVHVLCRVYEPIRGVRVPGMTLIKSYLWFFFSSCVAVYKLSTLYR